MSKKTIGIVLGIILSALATFGIIDKNDVCGATESVSVTK